MWPFSFSSLQLSWPDYETISNIALESLKTMVWDCWGNLEGAWPWLPKAKGLLCSCLLTRARQHCWGSQPVPCSSAAGQASTHSKTSFHLLPSHMLSTVKRRQGLIHECWGPRNDRGREWGCVPLCVLPHMVMCPCRGATQMSVIQWKSSSTAEDLIDTVMTSDTHQVCLSHFLYIFPI